MEPLAKTWVADELVASADLNQLQTNAVALRPSSGTATNSWSAVANGLQGVMFQSESNVVHVVARRFTDLSHRLSEMKEEDGPAPRIHNRVTGTLVRSRDFH